MCRTGLILALCCFFMACYGRHNGSSKTAGTNNEPPLLFHVTGIGNGYSSPAISERKLFVTGETDSIGYLYAYDLTGRLLWKTAYGREWTITYPGSRSKPVIVDSLIYLCSGLGEISCFSKETGMKRWAVNMLTHLGGVVPTFGYSMTIGIDSNQLFCSPGGSVNNVAALNRFSGALLWSTVAKGETAGYGAPLILSLPTRRLLVTSSEMNIMGLDASNGELLWTYELAFKGDVPCNTPFFDGSCLYWVAGPGNGAVAAKLSPDGSSISIQWKSLAFDTFFGDFVSIGKHLYGFSDHLHKFVALNATNGQITDSIPFGTGSVILIPNKLLAYNQKGQIGLIDYENGKINLLKTFRVTAGTREHFSHPVFEEDILFIRHGNDLLAYSMKNYLEDETH